MEKTIESLRHSQAKVTELEKINKRMHEQSHLDKKELVKVKEELQSYKSKVSEEREGGRREKEEGRKREEGGRDEARNERSKKDVGRE